MQNMYIIIVLMFCVNAMAIHVSVNEAEYHRRYVKRLSEKSRKLRSYIRSCLKQKTYQGHRKSIILLKILQHERKVHTKQVAGLHKK